jgi:hypothetical protein
VGEKKNPISCPKKYKNRDEKASDIVALLQIKTFYLQLKNTFIRLLEK